MKCYLQEKNKFKKNKFEYRLPMGMYIGIVFMICGMLCTGCGRAVLQHQAVDTAMGTIISQNIYGTAAEAQPVAEEIMSEIRSLEQNTLSRRLENTEIYRINQLAGSGQSIELSQALGEALQQCKRVYDASGGAFDVTLGNVVKLWDIDSRAGLSSEWTADFTGKQQNTAVEETVYQLPSEAQLEEALAAAGFHKLMITALDAGAKYQISVPSGMQLDMGAVGKGIVLDRAEDILQQSNVQGAVISAGGSILTYGKKSDGSTWNVGIVNPMDKTNNMGVLTLPGGCCVSTSGDYERYVEVYGVRYHHILNPKTGYPADSGVKSVTILFAEGAEHKGLLSDALSTACFVLGAEKGLGLAEEFGAEALFVDAEGEIIMTEGMGKYFHLSNGAK